MPFPGVSGLKLRLESDSISAADGDTPSTWGDSSGGGFDAVLTSCVYKTGVFLNSLPGLKFNGATSFGDLGAPSGLELYSAFTLFAVIRTSVDQTNRFVLAKDFSSGSRGYCLGLGSADTPYCELGGFALINGTGPGLNDDLCHVMALTYDGSTYSLYLDGVLIDSEAAGSATPNASAHWNIGRRSYVGSFSYFYGYIGAALIYNAGLGNTDRASIETYLTNKYVGPPPAPAARPYSAQISTSDELLILSYRNSNGVTAAAVSSVSGSCTLTVNGTPLTLSTWMHWGHGTVAFALCGGSKYAKLIDDTDGGFAEVTGSWTPVGSSGTAGEFYLPNETAVGSGFVKSASSNAKATYTFTGCVAGPHTLSHMLWDRPDTDRTTDATYTVKDGGGATLATYHVNIHYAGTPIWPKFDHIYNGYDWIYFRNGSMFDGNASNTFILPPGQTSVIVEVTNGTGTGTLVVDGLLLRNVLVSAVSPGDVVTLDMASGVVTTSQGAMPAIVARPVTFATDTDLMPYDAARPKTMLAGYNKEGWAPNSISLMAADRGPYTFGWSPVGGGSSITLAPIDGSLGPPGELTALTGQALRGLTGVVTGPMNSSPDGRFSVAVSDGEVFRIEFDYNPATISNGVANGPFDVTAQAGQTFSLATPDASVTKNDSLSTPGGYENLGGTRWRLWATFRWAPWRPSSVRGQPYYPWGMGDVSFVIDRIITGLSVFDEKVPIGWSSFTHPYIVDLYKNKGIGCFRLMDVMATNGSTVVDWGDYYPVNATGRDKLPYHFSQEILSIRAIDQTMADSDGVLKWFANEAFHSVVVLEVASTAGLVDGLPMAILPGGQTFPSDAATVAMAPGSVCIIEEPKVIALIEGSTTRVLARVKCSTGGPGPFPQTIGINPAPGDGSWTMTPGTVLFLPQPGQHPQLAAQMCAELAIPPWYNMPHVASDQYVRDWAAMAMSYAPVGTKIYVEYSNEIWNTNFGEASAYVGMRAVNGNYLHANNAGLHPRTFGVGYTWAAYRSDQMRSIAQGEFTTAGRPDDLYWILGTQGGGAAGVTQPQVEWGATQSPPQTLHFDGLCAGTYRSLVGCEDHALVTSAPNIDAFMDHLSLDGCIDLGTRTILDGGMPGITQAQRTLLDINGFSSTAIISYEGGWDSLCGSAGQGTVDVGVRWTQEISRSPRMYLFTLAEMQSLDVIGYTIRCRYTSDYAGGLGTEDWCDFPWIYCLRGTGSPSENTHPWDYDGAAFGTPVVSQTGGGLFAWAASFIPNSLAVNLRKLRSAGFRLRLK